MPKYTYEERTVGIGQKIRRTDYLVREPASECVLAFTESQVKAVIVVDALNKVGKYERALSEIAAFSSSDDSERHRYLVNLARRALREDI